MALAKECLKCSSLTTSEKGERDQEVEVRVCGNENDLTIFISKFANLDVF